MKYFILTGIIISGFLGVQLWGWLDPFALLTRSLAAISPSFEYLVFQSGLIAEFPRVALFPYLSIVLLVIFIGLNYYSRRFFCNVLCPLGALYGLIARFSFLKFSVNETCKSCGVCSKNCTYNGDPDKYFYSSECLVCFNCAVDCSTLSVETKFKFKHKNATQKIDLNRRKIIGSAIGGLFTAAIIKSTLKLKNKRHTFIRPPGAVKEQDFIEKCIRCGQCVQSCPTGFIQPAFSEAGLEGLWTPVVNPKAGYCLAECKTCTDVCPTKALKPLTLSEKKVFKIGTAIIDKNLCFTYADGFSCTVCYDKCPLKDKALKLHKVDVWNFMGRVTKVKQIYIDPDLCSGCGICENVCPRTDKPGIFITSADEQREKITGIV